MVEEENPLKKRGRSKEREVKLVEEGEEEV